MRRRTIARAAAWALLSSLPAGCVDGLPATQAVPVAVAAASATTEPSAGPGATASFAGEPIALSARALPPQWSLDGAVAEWGLDPKRNMVAVGVTPTKLVLAIAWAEPKPPVLSLRLASPAPMLPSIGWAQRGGTTHELTRESCQFEQIPLIEAGWDNGRPQPPEVAKACVSIVARYEEQGLAYRERFVRRLRIDGATVALLDAGGHAAPIAGAIVKTQGTSAEVELPLAALPEVSQAPLASLWAAAVFGDPPDTLGPPPLQPHPSSAETIAPSPGWTRLELAKPVAFGRMPDVLAMVFADASGVLNGGVMSQLSYSPAKPDTVARVTVPDVHVPPSKTTPNVPGAIAGPTAPDRPALLFSEEPLFETLETHGKLTVGRAYGSLVTLVDGKLVAQSYLSQPEAIQPRGDQLHLFGFDAGGYNEMVGFMPPAWRAVAIRPDGTIAEICDEAPDGPGTNDAWDGTPATFHAPDWSNFGMRGKRHGKPRAVTWQWDAAQARYVVSVSPAP